MKNYSNILLSLGVTLFLLTVGIKDEVDAQPTCNSPWTTMTEIVTVGGCNYLVEICILCQFSYPGQVKVLKFRNAGPCSNTLTEQQIIEGVENQLMSPYSLWLNLCKDTLPPCKNAPPYVVKLEMPICWKIKLDYQDLQDTTNNVCLSYPCDDDAYCQQEYLYCRDKYGNKIVRKGGYFGYNFPYSCTLESYQITRPTVLNDESDCFILRTPCNQ